MTFHGFSKWRQIAPFVYIHKTKDQFNNKKPQDSVLGLGEDIHQVSKDLTRRRPNDP
jgi:hypothetical protein